MTSEERKEIRYQRRKAKRKERECELTLQFDNLMNVCGIDVLLDCSYKSKKSANWKTSTQKFHINLLKNCITYSNKIKNNDNLTGKTVRFKLNERGKIRDITSVGFPQKVIQKAISKNVLIPLLSNSLIYDNGASIKNKGYDFSVNRLKYHLQKFYRENGFSNNGFVLLIDLKNFFASIPHDKLKEKISEKIHDEDLLYLIFSIIDENENGLPLGYETGQIEAIFYPNDIDHFVKDKCSIKYYGRYQDDSYIISDSKKELLKIKDDIINEYSKLGLKINVDKTKIIKLDDPQFKYLKNRVKLDENGKVVIKPNKKSIRNMRIKLGKFKKMYDAGEMTFDQINNCYQSWRGFMSRKNCYYTIKEMDRLFNEYFGKRNKKDKRKEEIKKPKRNIEEFKSIQDEMDYSCKRIEDKFYHVGKNKAIISYENK